MNRAEQLLAEIVALYAEDPPGSGKTANGEPYDPRWWFCTCESVVTTAENEGLLARYGARAIMWGGCCGDGHCWIELDGWIVDPTVGQFGEDTLPREGWVLAPGDERREMYIWPSLTSAL